MKNSHIRPPHKATAAPKSSSLKTAKNRSMLYERLEDRVLFDAVAVAPIDVDVEDGASLDQSNAGRFDASLYAEDVKVVADASLVAQDDQPSVADVRRELVIVDTSVENYQQLVDDLLNQASAEREFDVALIDGDTDGIAQINSILAGQSELNALHIVSHGDETGIRFGDVWLIGNNLGGYAGEIAQWGNAVAEGGDLLLLGCDIAATADGRELLQSISTLTGADVAASIDGTGYAPRGGDWDLEFILGEMETSIAFSDNLQTSWRGLLAPAAQATLNVPSQVPLGEDVNFTVTFRNTGPSGDVGYGPFVDVLIPHLGEDGVFDGGSYTDTADGLDVAASGAVTYLGLPVNYQVLTFDDVDGAGGLNVGTITHPYGESIQNETQLLGLSGTVDGGTFTLSFGGQTTSDISWNANAATVQAALEGLSSIGAGNIAVSGSTAAGEVMELEFTGSLAASDQATITADNSLLTGGGSATVLDFITGDAAAQATKVYGHAGDKLVVVELPFGSFTPEQPAAAISINATMSDHADLNAPLTVRSRGGFRYGADALNNPNVDGTLFSDVQTNANNWVENDSVTPTLMTVSKTSTAPENETATGPNYVRQWTMHVDIPDGQTITDLDIFDDLPSNIVFLSLDSITSTDGSASFTSNVPGGTNVLGTPTNNSGYTGANTHPTLNVNGVQNNQSLVVTANSVTGTASDRDVSITFSYYVEEFDANIDRVIPINGEDDTTTTPDSRSHNNVRALGDWTPVDVRDAGGIDNAAADPVGYEHTVDDKAIAIQKGVTVVDSAGDPTGDTTVVPGSLLKYTLSFQISDYYTFGDLVLTDTFSDGQQFYAAGGLSPTFSVSDFNNSFTNSGFNVYVGAETTPTSEATTDNFIVDRSEIDHGDDNSENSATDGTTTITIQLSERLQQLGDDGILQGGLSNGATNLGAATGTITFYTQVQDTFADTFDSGDRSVDQGDVLTNTVSIAGTVRENQEDDTNSTLFETLHNEEDGSGASIQVAQGSLTKSIYAVNGSTLFGSPVDAAPGDRITYRLTYQLPTTDFEDLIITDYFPLPVFDVDDPDANGILTANWTFDADQSSNQMLPGVVELLAINGADGDTFYDIWDTSDNGLLDDSVAPTLSIDSNANSLAIDFGTFDEPGFRVSQVDLLLTVTVLDDPFADGLFLTNQAQAGEGTTNGTPVSQVDLVQIRLTQPVIDGISKGIVDSEKTTAFDAGGVTFAETSTTAGFSGGSINSDWLDNNTFDTLITNLDAGDRARFAVVVENTGSSRHGAFDVTIADTLDAGLSYVAGSLRVYNGNGTALTYSGSDTDLFAGGITLDDPTATDGALDEFHATNGLNVAVLVYDVTIDNTAKPLQELNNTASLTGYAGQDGGQNHVVTPPEASAGVSIINVAATKSIDSTSEAHTTSVGGVEKVAIGEIVRYRIEMEIPEGTSPVLTLRDKLPAGLTFIDDGTATVAFVSDSGNMTSSTLSGAGLNITDTGTIADADPTFVLPDSAISESDDPGVENDTWATGDDPYFKLGTVVNNDSDADKEYVVIEFNALVDNNSGPRNDVNESLYNDLEILIDSNANGTIETSEEIFDLPDAQRPRVQIVEPLIQNFAKNVDFSSGDAGDPVSYTISFDVATGNARTDAFDVNITDSVPAEMLVNLASMQVRVDGILQTAGTDYTDNSSGSTIDLSIDQLAKGASVTVTFDAVVDISVNPTEVVTNRANVTWTSRPGSFGTSNGTGGNSTGSDLTSLDDVNTGGDANPEYNTKSGETQGERDGSGQNDPANSGDDTQPNDYHATSSATVTIDGTSISKSMDGTSIDDSLTTGNNVDWQAVIGEVATYTVTLDFSEATIPNATLTDNMQAGLAFIGVTNTTINGVTLDAAVDLTNPTVSNNGRTVVWDLQTIVDASAGNPDTDGRITITYEAVVTNVAANVDGIQRSNSATFQWDDDPGTAPNPRELVSAAANLTIIEPEVVVAKSVALDTDQDSAYDDGTTGDAGDGIRYTITLTNSQGVDAFDIGFSDDLPTAGGGLSAILNPVLTVNDSAVAGAVSAADFELVGDNNTGWTVRKVASSNIDMLGSQVDGSGNPRVITLTVTGTIGSSVAPNQSVNNIATATWTSQDGTFTGPSSFTNDDTERTGTDGAGASNLNNYEYSDNAVFTVSQPTFAKHFFGTDQSETSGSNVTIGETVTYALLIQLPEGTSPDATVVDQLPDGLTYISSQIITSAAASGGLLTNDFNGSISGGGPAVSGGISSGDDVTFTFGQITVGFNNDGSDNAFLLLVDAMVVDQASNAGYVGNQTTLTNDATIDFSTDAQPPQAAGPVDVTVVEPNLSITKEFGPTVDVDVANADDTVSIVLTVDNSTDLSAAYGVVIEDVLDPAFYDTSTVNFGAAGAAYPTGFAPSVDTVSGRVLYSGGTIAAGATETFAFSVKLLTTVTPNATDVNTVTITDATTLLGNISGERNTPDADGDNSHTDTDSIRIRTNSLSGYVYDDTDNDGTFDGGESGIVGVTVRLEGLDHLGNSVSVNTSTVAGGFYSFEGLRPGTYRIVEDPASNSIPTGFLDGRDTIGTPGGNDSAIDEFSNVVLPLTTETSGTNNNFGEIRPASLSGIVYDDNNSNGTFDGTDSGIDGVTVRLTGRDDLNNVVDITIATSGGGLYSFDNLRPSDSNGYTITETQPALYRDGVHSDGSLANGDITVNDVISSINVVPGNDGTGYNFGEVRSSLGDTVYFDANNNGTQDGGEQGMGNVDVILQFAGADGIFGNTDDPAAVTTTTDANGDYNFSQLLNGNYQVTVDTGTLPIGMVATQERDDAVFGAPSIDGTARVVIDNADRSDVDFGFTGQLNLGDNFWHDADGDGTRSLVDSNNDGTPNTPEPGIGDVTVNLTFAGADNNFATTNDNLTLTTTTLADGSYNFANLPEGEFRISYVASSIPAEFTASVETDDSAAAVDGTANVSLNADRTDIDFGFVAGGSIGDTVFFDADGDGIQDDGSGSDPAEPGVGGIAVELDVDHDSDGSVDYTLRTVTVADGTYAFSNLASGNYTVRVTPPAGTAATSDADGIGSPHQSSLSLLANETNTAQDFGYTGTSSLYDTVFFDIDNDATDDTATNDRGLPGVDVTLSIDIDGDGTTDYTRTQVTDGNGDFLFANLIPGTYTLTTDGSDMAAGLANNPTVDNDGLLTPRAADYTVGVGESVTGTGFGFHAVPDYEIVKTGNFTVASAGDTIQYTIAVRNIGELDGRNVTISDSFPANVLNVTNASGGTVDNTAGTIEWTLPAMQPNDQVVLTVTATVKDPLPAGIHDFTNSVTVDDDHYNGNDPDTSNNGSSYTATLDSVPEYAITKSNGGTINLSPGDRTTYTISVTNNGKQDGTGVVVTDHFPLDTLIVVDADGGTVDTNAGTITWNVGDLDAGDSVFFNVTFDVVDTAVAAQTNVINNADVHDDGLNGPDPNLSNNTASDNDPLLATPDYRLTKTLNGSPAFVEPGQAISYSILVENIGDQNGTGVIVTDSFPTSLLTNVNAVGGTLDATNGTISWNIGDLAGGGESVLLTVTAEVRSSVASGVEVIVNDASVTDDLTNGPDPTPANNLDDDTTTLQAQPDLTITKSDGDLDYAEPGDTVIYTITYNNVGNQDSTGVTITETLPDGSTFNVGDSTAGWIDNLDGTFTFNVGILNAGDGGAIEFAVIADDVIDPNREELVNTVSITDDTSNGPDPTPENNIAQDTTPLQVFVFDSFQDPSGHNKDLDTYNGVDIHLPHGEEFAHRLKPLPIDTVYTGIVDPGTTLSGKIYDQRGRLVGEQTVVADGAGNWLMQFPTVVLYEQPHEMRVDQTLAVQNSTNFAGFNLRRFFHPAVHSQLYMNEPVSVGAAFRHDPFSVVQAIHAANNDPLGFDWTHHTYELIVSSSNTSAM